MKEHPRAKAIENILVEDDSKEAKFINAHKDDIHLSDGEQVYVCGVAIKQDSLRILPRSEWMRRADIRQQFGIGKDIIDEWVAQGMVEAHKVSPSKTGTVIFNTMDIRKAIAESPRYIPTKG